jgi:hypothetical protein
MDKIVSRGPRQGTGDEEGDAKHPFGMIIGGTGADPHFKCPRRPGADMNVPLMSP